MSTGLLQNSLIFIILVLGPLVILTLAWSVALLFGKVIPYFKFRRKPEATTALREFPTSSKAKLVSVVNEETKASYGLCKRALEEVEYDIDKAVRLLYVTSFFKDGEPLKYSRIHAYMHQDVIGVLVEVGCVTEKTANSVAFGMFLQDIAYQIAVTNPEVIQRNLLGPVTDPLSSIPPPPPSDGGANILLEQFSVFPDTKDKTIQQLINELSFKVNEPIVIRRFSRYAV